jgi:hypothetical protein
LRINTDFEQERTEGTEDSEVSEMNEVYLYGAGGISKIIYEILLSMGKQVKGVFDDDPPNAKFRDLPSTRCR